MKVKPLYDVVLVSAFGRLESLGTELAQRGMSVALLDLTPHFQTLDWRDINGPFPMVTPSPALPSHLDWLVAHASTELQKGFSLWMRSGPVELRGPLGTFYSEKNLEVGLLKDYLARRLQSKKMTSIHKLYRELSFQESWLIHLSHALTQNQMTLHCRSAFSGEAFPLNQSVQLLRLNKENLKDLRSTAANAGVETFEQKNVKDIHVFSKNLDSIELESGAFLRASFFVWGLNQEESFYINPPVFSKIFNRKEAVLSDWVWRRLELKTEQELFQAMPECFLMIQCPDWSWTNENFVLFKKDHSGEWDLWVRTPRHHFEGEGLVIKIREELQNRLGSFEGEILLPPSPDVYSFAIYESHNVSSLPKILCKNVFFEGSEKKRRLDMASRFENQVGLLGDLELRKQKRDKRNMKRGGVIDSTIHAP